MFKKSIAAILVLMIVFSSGSVFAQGKIRVFINGTQLNLSVEPKVEKGTTLVPMRSIFEALGVPLKWDKDTQSISAEKDGKKIKLTIGQSMAYLNGEKVKLAVPAKVVKGNTMIPLRFVAEALGSKVEWRESINSVLISTGSYVYDKDFAAGTYSELYTVNGTGQYAGYKRLKGYNGDDKYYIYFKGDSSSFSTVTVDNRNINMNQTVTWKYGGKTYKSTKKELHAFFLDSAKIKNYLGVYSYTFTEEWYRDTFGAVYEEWLLGFAMDNDAPRWVEQYFAQFDPPSNRETINDSFGETAQRNYDDDLLTVKPKSTVSNDVDEEYAYVSEGEMESMMLGVYIDIDSIIIYDILDNEIIYILDNIPANLKVGVVYESNDIRYKLDNDRSILLNREDLIATDVYRGAR